MTVVVVQTHYTSGAVGSALHIAIVVTGVYGGHVGTSVVIAFTSYTAYTHSSTCIRCSCVCRFYITVVVGTGNYTVSVVVSNNTTYVIRGSKHITAVFAETCTTIVSVTYNTANLISTAHLAGVGVVGHLIDACQRRISTAEITDNTAHLIRSTCHLTGVLTVSDKLARAHITSYTTQIISTANFAGIGCIADKTGRGFISHHTTDIILCRVNISSIAHIFYGIGTALIADNTARVISRSSNISAINRITNRTIALLVSKNTADIRGTGNTIYIAGILNITYMYIIICLTNYTAHILRAGNIGVVVATIDTTVFVSGTSYTSTIAVAGVESGVVGKFIEVAVGCVTHNTAGVAAAVDSAAHGKVMDFCTVVGGVACHIAEHTAIAGSGIVYKQVGDGMSVTVEMAAERSALRRTYNLVVGYDKHIKVVDNLEIASCEIHAHVNKHSKGIESERSTYKVRIDLCAGAATELRTDDDTHMLSKVLCRTRNGNKA